MTLDEFEAGLAGDAPPPGLSAPLTALWWAHRGEWDRAHNLVQDASGSAAAWVHAHLHRVEGDMGNANFWYRKAGRPAASNPFADERLAIAAALLGT